MFFTFYPKIHLLLLIFYTNTILISHNTKSKNAEPYLSEGDFHIYLDEGKPRLGVRFDGDEIVEIQGQENNCGIIVSPETTAIILYHMGMVKSIHS